MESFLPVSSPLSASSGDKDKFFFQGVDLRTQPSLTKRGRKTKQIVQRVFVIVEGRTRNSTCC